jgi:hypothetical protein
MLPSTEVLQGNKPSVYPFQVPTIWLSLTGDPVNAVQAANSHGMARIEIETDSSLLKEALQSSGAERHALQVSAGSDRLPA